jgi:tetratricopeptide (TPR) repeat protein
MAPNPDNPTEGAPGLDGRTREILALTEEAQGLLSSGRLREAANAAHRAVGMEPRTHRPWLVLARILEAQGGLDAAYQAYIRAVGLANEAQEFAGEMGRLALRLGINDAAEQLLAMHLQASPESPDMLAALAEAQMGRGAFDEAHATLKVVLEADPTQPQLWRALGRLLCMEGRHAQSIVFFEESLRLDPHSAAARDGLAEALLHGAGDVDEALRQGAQAVALAQPTEAGAIVEAQARRLLAAGRLADGWKALADADRLGYVETKVAAPRWDGASALEGRLLVTGEPHTLDEVLLAYAVPALIDRSPPLMLAVSERWEALARRSFPEAVVVPLLSRLSDGRRQLAVGLDSPHGHAGERVGAWTPFRAMLAAGQPDFRAARPYLQVDEERVRHWRDQLRPIGPGPKIGVLWRPPEFVGGRAWELPPLSALRRPLSTPGLRLVAVRPEASIEDFDGIREAHGLEVYDPIGLKRGDLDDLAALMCALDVTVGPPHEATFAAAACGAEVWFLSLARHWAMLGTGGFPCFPRARTIIVPAPDDWAAPMAELEAALAALARPA